ncbi:MAG: GGDEF domain-containing protein, partial [Clostridiales Family XIII bacterium]|nr:GGDEF domain-containing protein [Clostridiales Family XIII bacterium]
MNAPDFGSLSLSETVTKVSAAVTDFLRDNELLYFWLPIIVFAFAVVSLLRAIHGKKKKGLENTVYIVYCSFVIAIIIVSIVTQLFVADFSDIKGLYAYLGLGAYAAYVSLPAIFCLHVWSQTNYKKMSLGTIIGYFVVPGILTAWAIVNYTKGEFIPDVWTYQTMFPLSYMGILLIGYWIVMTVKSFLLCFDVFYQMPKHMRGSTGLLVTAIAVFSAECILAFLIDNRASFMLCLLALAFVLERSFAGFFRASASNVIATSRKFVFSNLTTMVLILSSKERILEWNKVRDNFVFEMLVPKYRQPFRHYREKLLKLANGVVSSHDENIITLTHDGREHHLLITPATIKEGDREFGKLIEIADVTHIYSVLRHFESIAVYDQLTRLFNRNAYLAKAAKSINAADLPLLIIIGDVNNLKLVNDSVGHLAGDRLLIAVS